MGETTDFIPVLRDGKEQISDKKMKKIGTIALGVVESTPVVWKNELWRFEWVRNNRWNTLRSGEPEEGHYRFVRMKDGVRSAPFAFDHSFGCCHCEDGVMYVCGVEGKGGGRVLNTFRSCDLKRWEQKRALEFPEDISLYNTSICRAENGFLMAIEIGGKNPAVGKAFTVVFARSKDLINWEMLDMMKYSYSRERYTACPVIRYVDGKIYMIILESLPLHRWAPYIYRTGDLEHFEPGLKNPFMMFDDDDKKTDPDVEFTSEQLGEIKTAVNCNASDIDLCEFEGKTHILYSWGNQLGREYLARAEYDGGVEEFLKSFF